MMRPDKNKSKFKNLKRIKWLKKRNTKTMTSQLHLQV